jgi:hypothetical protein
METIAPQRDLRFLTMGNLWLAVAICGQKMWRKVCVIERVFNSLERDYRDFVGLLGLRIATSKWATDREIAEKGCPESACLRCQGRRSRHSVGGSAEVVVRTNQKGP